MSHAKEMKEEDMAGWELDSDEETQVFRNRKPFFLHPMHLPQENKRRRRWEKFEPERQIKEQTTTKINSPTFD